MSINTATTELQAVRDIVVYGPETCGGCDSALTHLWGKGIAARKVVIDSTSTVVNELRTGNAKVETPIVKADDVLIFTGRNRYAVMALAKQEHKLLVEAGIRSDTSDSSSPLPHSVEV